MSPEKQYTRPLIDKLGVKPGAKVAVIDVDDPGFMKVLRERTSDIVLKRPRTPCDVVFLGVNDVSDLQRIKEVKRSEERRVGKEC